MWYQAGSLDSPSVYFHPIPVILLNDISIQIKKRINSKIGLHALLYHQMINTNRNMLRRRWR
jgi:hypothetical protein